MANEMTLVLSSTGYVFFARPPNQVRHKSKDASAFE